MRTAIPPLTEQADARKHRLQREHDGHQKPRLQRLSLLARGHAQTRQDVAQRLGVHRHPVGRWLAIYAGGLPALLATDVPAGQPVSLTPDVRASRAQGRHRAEGFASDKALRHGCATRLAGGQGPHALHAGARALQGQARRGSAPSHQNILRPFRRSRPPVRPHSSRSSPRRTTCPVRVFSPDESRFG